MKYSGYFIGSALGGLIVTPFVGPEIALFAVFFSSLLCVVVELVASRL